MTPVKTDQEIEELLERHLSLSLMALRSLGSDGLPRLVIWPESPMNFTYANDAKFQDVVRRFTKDNHTSLLRSEEHTSELQSHLNLVCRLLLEKKNISTNQLISIPPL